MDFTKFTKSELISVCKEKHISGYSGKKKDELIKMLTGVVLVAQHPDKSISDDSCAKPVIKWVGGKSQILNTVLELFPKEFNNYHEPFLGGGSVLIGLLMKQRAGSIEVNGTIYASDLNLALISVYQNIQSRPQALIEELTRIITQYTDAKQGTVVNRDPVTMDDALSSEESYYYYIRKKYNSLPRETVTASAMFIFMNKTGFRGVYREGPNGFNVPFGHYLNPGIMDEAHILFISELVKDVVFMHRPYGEALSHVVAGDFVYLDPPYAPENDKSFVSYNACGFNLGEHINLFNQCLQMNEKNVKFVLSNSDVPMVKTMFLEPLYKTKIVSCKRSINSTDPSAKTNEVLINN
jgi:DNA adenine methylase